MANVHTCENVPLQAVKIVCLEIIKDLLEQRQDKNYSIQSKIIPILKLTRFFPHLIKRAAISNWELFLTEWSRSNIILALAIAFKIVL